MILLWYATVSVIIVNKALLKSFEKVQENVGMNWWKKYGDKVGIKCIQEQLSNIHKPHPQTCPYMWCT